MGLPQTYLYQREAHLGGRLVLGQGDPRQQRRVADDARVRVAVDVGPPLPARDVRVPRADVLGLPPLKLLRRAKFVRLEEERVSA